MTPQNAEEQISVALHRLKLQFTFLRAENGLAYWHVPFINPPPKGTLLIISFDATSVAVVTGLGRPTSSAAPARLLELGRELRFCRFASNADGDVFVVADIPPHNFDDTSLQIAMSAVLQAVNRLGTDTLLFSELGQLPR